MGTNIETVASSCDKNSSLVSFIGCLAWSIKNVLTKITNYQWRCRVKWVKWLHVFAFSDFLFKV